MQQNKIFTVEGNQNIDSKYQYHDLINANKFSLGELAYAIAGFCYENPEELEADDTIRFGVLGQSLAVKANKNVESDSDYSELALLIAKELNALFCEIIVRRQSTGIYDAQVCNKCIRVLTESFDTIKYPQDISEIRKQTHKLKERLVCR